VSTNLGKKLNNVQSLANVNAHCSMHIVLREIQQKTLLGLLVRHDQQNCSLMRKLAQTQMKCYLSLIQLINVIQENGN